MAEGGHHLRNGVRMQIDGLDRDQGTEACRVLDDDVRHEPRIEQPIVGGDEDTFAPGLLTPARYVGHPLAGAVRMALPGLRAGGKELSTHVAQAIHGPAHAPLAPLWLTVPSA